MVEMKTELAFERHNKVVLGLEAAFSFNKVRTIAGCWVDFSISEAGF
jgi:hypothetical protein